MIGKVEVVWGRPADDPGDAPRMAQWGRAPIQDDKPHHLDVTVIEGARVFPGTIQSRGADTHEGGQLVLDAEFGLIAASWCRMDGRLTLPAGVVLSEARRHLAGDHLFLGSVHPHFGHTVLEGLARAWAAPAFLERHPEGLCIVYEDRLSTFGAELLARAGIRLDRVLTLTEAVRIERLHIPDPAQKTHHWVSPELVELWQGVGRSACATTPSAGRRTWLSRRGVTTRRLREEAEIERRFANAGFDIVRPESLPLEEQLRIARRSDILAGCAGSQMYLAAFQPPGGQTAVMAPSNFLFPDDAIIAQALDRRLIVAFGSAIRYREPNSAWSIDPAAATAVLARLVAGADGC